MPARVIDCTAIANEIKEEIKSEVEMLKKKGIVPGIATLLVGDNFGAKMYRGQVEKFCAEVGFHYINMNPPATASEKEVMQIVRELNQDGKVSGILPLRPFPEQISDSVVINSIDLNKDIDCFHPYNMGKLALGEVTFAPATPAACIEILEREKLNFVGAEIVVVGHSNIVGKPAALLCLNRNATTTNIHVFTAKAGNSDKHTLGADILIVGAGVPNLIKKHQVKKGAIVIDVGINRVKVLDEKGQPVLNDKGKPKTKTVGDVAFDEVSQVASAITQVPGGVGVVTNMMLMKNALKACKIQHKL
ncbi:MAG: bifunctional methylenetetrahydrofolate dehydrogenase/methenyltetrahydrofolate cyclohydrolase [Nitrospirae bacterium CG17_big_fil_post_rev_8_21_14_2_50_50_9]|nr:MAG: bifunctional methylenetetrahydrofolate dehydrogenase/methenyltetrahydrofolate cyclohydrolase [Nitrospirae bacterium CG17_big_fil_post_rev_8_21_14_2_50_50_9]